MSSGKGRKKRLAYAIKILRRFEDWRRGYDCRTMDEAGITPRKLRKAIGMILKHHGMPNPLMRCRECVHYSDDFGGCVKMHSFKPGCKFKRRKEE